MLPLPISIANVGEVFDREGRSLDPGAEQLIPRSRHEFAHLHRAECLSLVTLERLRREGQQVSPKIIAV